MPCLHKPFCTIDVITFSLGPTGCMVQQHLAHGIFSLSIPVYLPLLLKTDRFFETNSINILGNLLEHQIKYLIKCVFFKTS